MEALPSRRQTEGEETCTRICRLTRMISRMTMTTDMVTKMAEDMGLTRRICTTEDSNMNNNSSGDIIEDLKGG